VRFHFVKLYCSDIACETVIQVDWSHKLCREWFWFKLIGSLDTDNINLHVQCFIEQHTQEQALLHLTLQGYISRIRIKFLLCVFLFVKTYISAKLIFHKSVKKRIRKCVPFNWRLNHLN
jgi:hypothetical protein